MANHDDWRFFDHDDVTGVTTWLRFDGDKVHVRKAVVVDDMLGENEALRALTHGQKHGDGLSLAARVPMHIFQRELAEPIMQGDERHVQRWLKDSNHRAWLTRDGKA